MNDSSNKQPANDNVQFAWVWSSMKKLKHGYCQLLRFLMPKGELWQAEQERDEMERQMTMFREALQATLFWSKNAYPEGMTEEDVRKELTDYYWLIQEVGEVYYTITEGLVSQQATKANAVIRIVDDITARKICETEERLNANITFLEEEMQRLKDGQFTPEEFQNLCHTVNEHEGCHKFAEGCLAYQRQLFGYTPLKFKEE